jgi:hypothetical protein
MPPAGARDPPVRLHGQARRLRGRSAAGRAGAAAPRTGPFAIRIAYRPDAPSQAWLADLGPGFGWDLHRFSVEVLFGQCFFMFILVFGPLLTSAEAGSVVDWREGIASIPLSLRESVPMLIEASWVAFMGYMEVTTFQRML